MPGPKHYERPPLDRTADGSLRRVGVEFEFAGLELPDAARVVAEVFDGEVEAVSAYEQVVHTDTLGPFSVELDFEYLKARGRAEKPEPSGLAAGFDQLSNDAIASIVRHIVPLEVVTPPIPLDRLPDLDELVDALRAAGVRGTGHSAIYAFGLHLNPEMPALDAATLLAYTRSFLCLHDWLVEREAVDLSRRITPYINAFPRDYVALALSPAYEPDANRFADDYLTWNADRNRALDLLPLLAHLDEDRVRRAVDDPRIKSRPALHYRLPNCEIDVEGWHVHAAWTRWLVVERLAAEPQARAELCAEYLAHLDGGLGTLLDPWWKKCDALIATNGR